MYNYDNWWKDPIFQEGKAKEEYDWVTENFNEFLKEYGYINDENFCESYINSYRTSKSKKKLKYDLMTKGIKENIIVEKLEELLDDEEERENLLNLAQKYMKNKEFDLKNKQKF